MEYRVVWVHGIGTHSPGYSKDWTRIFGKYLNPPMIDDDYVEVDWDVVFNPAFGGTRGLESAAPVKKIKLTPAEKKKERQVRQELESILLARSSAMAEASSADEGTRGGEEEIIEWSDSEFGLEATGTRGFFNDWVRFANDSLGDFVKYIVSKDVRTEVKEKFKEKVRPLADLDATITVISHSWGTVVAYDSLLDLQKETPALKVANLITVGSPLWMVRTFLDDKSGRKPDEVTNWINITAKGDLIGSWLNKNFKVTKDYQVAKFGDGDAHGSYFVEGNEQVQKDLVAHYILG